MSATATYSTQHFIAGQKRDASDGARFDKFEPASGQVLARVAAGTTHDVDAAVAAARAQFDGGA
ncbi:MAG: aldehyde dehydrogenase family protein, partial [Variovorax sp.]